MSNDRPEWVEQILQEEFEPGTLVRQIEQFLRQQCPDGATVAQIAAAVGKSDKSVRGALNEKMKPRKLAVPARAAKCVRWRVYRITGNSIGGIYQVLPPGKVKEAHQYADRRHGRIL